MITISTPRFDTVVITIGAAIMTCLHSERLVRQARQERERAFLTRQETWRLRSQVLDRE